MFLKGIPRNDEIVKDCSTNDGSTRLVEMFASIQLGCWRCGGVSLVLLFIVSEVITNLLVIIRLSYAFPQKGLLKDSDDVFHELKEKCDNCLSDF